MLPNEYHPSSRCSCDDCLRSFPEKRRPGLTREEFNRLLDSYVDAFGDAYAARDKSTSEYRQTLEKAAEARQALVKAVFE